MYKYLLMVLVIFTSNVSYAQFISYHLVCKNALKSNDYQIALTVCEEQLKLAQSNHSLLDEAKIFLSLSTIHHQLSNIVLHEKFLALVREHSLFDKTPELKYSWNRQIGKLEYLKSNFTLSKQYFTKSLEIGLQRKEFVWQSKSYNDLAIVERELGNYTESMHHYGKSLELKQKFGDLYSTGLTFRSIALTHIKLEEYDHAIQYLTLSLQTFLQYLASSKKDQRIETTISSLYEDFAQTYVLIGNYELAKVYREKIINTINLKFSPTAMVRAYINLSRTYKNSDDLQKATLFLNDAQKLVLEQDYSNRLNIYYELSSILIQKNEFQIAIKHALSGLRLSRQKQNIKDADFLKLLSSLYKESNPAISLHYLEQYLLIREQFLEKKYNDNLKTIQHKMEIQHIEFELEKKKGYMQRLINWSLIIAILLLLSIGFIFVNFFKKKKEKQALLQSINNHKQQLLLLENTVDKNSQNNHIKSSQKLKLQQLLVNTMIDTVNIWETHTNLNKVELAEQSKIWTVTIDSGTLRTRSLDKYLSIKNIPTNPKWRNVIKTCHFILTDPSLSTPNRKKLEEHLYAIMKHIKELSLKA